MAQLDDLYAALKKADAAGDTAGAKTLADYIRSLPTDSHAATAAKVDNDPISQGARNFASDMPLWRQVAAGYGKAVPDAVQGIGQRLGLVDQSSVDEGKRLDAPLMRTAGGVAGDIGGNIAMALPTVAIPGAASILGAGAVGGTLGAIQPTATGESALKNAGIGAALGGGSVLGGQLLGAGYRGLKAIAEPFTEAGPQRIAGRTIQRFAEDPSRIANVTNAPTLTGARPTLAEQTGDVGLARLQDSLRSVDPQINNALAGRAAENNASRVNALRDMAGGDGKRDFFVADRDAVAKDLYGRAFDVVPDTTGMTAEQSRTMQTLLKAPAIKSAMNDARAIAANRGTNVGPSNASGSIQGLHDMKTAMDDAIAAAKSAGNDNKAASIKDAQQRLVGLIEQMSPDYKAARTVYADMSRPINQMDIAGTLAKKGFSNGSDLTGNPTINRNALLGAMKDEPALIQQATGRRVGNALSDVMEPDQMNMLNALRSEVDRAGAVATAGNGPGSATAQRLASQNILRQVITPNAAGANPSFVQRAGQAIVDNTLANTVVGKATNWIYSGIAEPKIQQALLKAVLSPEEAKQALLAAQKQGVSLPNNLLTRLAGQARRVTGVSASQATRQP